MAVPRGILRQPDETDATLHCIGGESMTTLRIILRNYADFENALEEEARLFEALHPFVRVEMVPSGIHDLYTAAIAEGGLRDGRFDLALLVTDWLADGMESRALEDLQPWQQRNPIPDWPEGWARSLVRPLIFGETLSSLPWHDGPECLVYRTDLFSEPERKAVFHERFGRVLAPPKTWQEFEETARFFTDSTVGCYGTVFAAFPDGHNTLYDFALQLWSRGGELQSTNGKPHLTSPQAAAAVDFYRRVVRDSAVCHPRSMELDSTQSGDIFLAGEVAMMANWFGFAARAGRKGSPLAGKVAIAPVPAEPDCEHVSLSVFWALAMGVGSRNKELAWEFLRFVATSERDFGITQHGAVGVRLSTWRNPRLQERIPAYCEIEAISLGARQLPTGPQMAQFAAVIDGIVTRALTTTDASVAILEAAQVEIERKGLRLS
jgi:multiple sugar transport system substrate-binding protein